MTLKTAADIALRHLRSGEFDGHFSRAESLAVHVGDVVDVDDGHDFVSALAGDGLYHVAHLAVSYKGYFHSSRVWVLLISIGFHAPSDAVVRQTWGKTPENAGVMPFSTT